MNHMFAFVSKTMNTVVYVLALIVYLGIEVECQGARGFRFMAGKISIVLRYLITLVDRKVFLLFSNNSYYKIEVLTCILYFRRHTLSCKSRCWLQT